MSAGRRYRVEVEEVHSGDDVVVMVDLGIDKLFKRVRCRLAGVDTPNAFKAKGDSEAGLLREEVRELISGCTAYIEVVAEGKGGWLVTLIAQDQKTGNELNINEYLKGRGFVYKGRVDATSRYAENPQSTPRV